MAKPLIGTEELSRTARELIDNQFILEPDLPATILAARAIEAADSVYLAELASALTMAHFARLVRSSWQKRSALKRQQLLLPGYEHLPLRIRIGPNKSIALDDATFTDVRSYYRLLNRNHRIRKKDDPKLAEAKTLMERMQAGLNFRNAR